jgi:hypothetical protein
VGTGPGRERIRPAANDLRGKVRVQTDGGLKTGLDVIKAAILGADSFGFGTAPMIALGCKYLRICHLNNCATGVATQNEKLRKDHFIGTAEMVVNFFRYVAEETREWLAPLGVRSLEELIGRTDLLDILEGQTAKQRHLDLTPLLGSDHIPAASHNSAGGPQPTVRQRPAGREDGRAAASSINDASGGEFSLDICNCRPQPSAHACPAKSRASTATRAWPDAPITCASRAPRARASACGTLAACTCTWKATPTTTSARAWPAASW